MHVVRKAVSLFLMAVVTAGLLAACKGGDNTTASLLPPSAMFKSTVTPGNLTVTFDATGSKSADGSAATFAWTFGDQVLSTSTQATTGSPVTHIYAQPGSYDVTLTVTDDHGTSVEITHSIVVTGTPSTTLGVENWTWIDGGNYADGTGTYQTQFTPDPRNLPSSRQLGATWYSGGKLWMFGGSGYDSTGATGSLSDLWYFTPGTATSSSGATLLGGNWTWVAGSNKANSVGIYPASAGTFSATSLPGARSAAAAWTDLNGNMWLFGGSAYDAKGNFGVMNDMWSFSSTGQAQWTGGNNVVNDAGSSTYPGARAYAATWTDSNGNFWLFGGQDLNSAGAAVYLNDLWCFTPAYTNDSTHQHPSCDNEAAGGNTLVSLGTTITSGTWTKISGGGTTNAPGVYGTQNVAAAANAPGARISPQTWVDGSGTLWMFGGSGADSASAIGSLNDVWSFNTKTKQWTWVAGANTYNAAEVTGTQGVAASTNTPSARLGTLGWTDASGTLLWMFGGSGTDSTGTSTSSDGGGALNELWAFNTVTHNWAYVAGTTTAGTGGVYGTAGVPSIYSLPGSRLWGAIWVDSSSNAWMFGGAGEDAVANSGTMNDLWMVNITTKPH